jgi:hypothetical protein
MKLLTQHTFLSMFHSRNSRTFEMFLKNAKVKSNFKLTPLKEYMKKNGIKTADVRQIYYHIVNRDEYLTRFFYTSLFSESIGIRGEIPMKEDKMNNNALVKYKNIIRNMHFKDILQKTKSGFQIPTYLDVLYDLYTKEIIDYKILTPSALKYIQDGRIGSVFSSFYFRASIMNPYLVYSLNMSVLKGTKIFTPTLGWSSYAYGFLECPIVKEYVGVDVIPDVCKKTGAFLGEHYPKAKHNIICSPSEDLFNDARFMRKYREHFDVVFFSPPYYELELYPGKNQSTTKYKTYEEWLYGYWYKTIQLCYYLLENNGTLCYILSSGGGQSQRNILEDMNNMTRSLFKEQKVLQMYNKNVHVTAGSHRETNEKIMIYKKR